MNILTGQNYTNDILEKNFQELRTIKMHKMHGVYKFETTGVNQAIDHSEGIAPSGVLVLSSDGDYGHMEMIESSRTTVTVKAGNAGVNVTVMLV